MSWEGGCDLDFENTNFEFEFSKSQFQIATRFQTHIYWAVSLYIWVGKVVVIWILKIKILNCNPLPNAYIPRGLSLYMKLTSTLLWWLLCAFKARLIIPWNFIMFSLFFLLHLMNHHKVCLGPGPVTFSYIYNQY